MPGSKTALVRMPLFLLARAEEMGVDRARLLEQARLTEAELRDPDARIQVRKNVALWKAVLDALPDEDLGVKFSERFELSSQGLVGYVMLHSATLGDALKRLVRFGHILDETFPPALEVRGRSVEYSVEPVPQQLSWARRVADYDLGALLSAARELTGVELRPLEVHLCYPRPAHHARLQDFFGAPILYERRMLRLFFSKRSLDLSVLGADVEIGRYLERHAGDVLRRLAPGGSMGEKVKRALWMGMKDGRIGLADVAESLAISPRTLQRRLREEATSFDALRDEFRREMALDILEDRELAVCEVAFLLGYSEPSSFHRAFHRWTGSTPQQFRLSHRSDP